MPGEFAIGVDAGGTKIAALLVDEAGSVVERRLLDTPAEDAEATTRAIIAAAGDLAANGMGAGAVGVGAAGMVDRNGMVVFAPNIAWRDFPLKERIRRELGIPTLVDNDANAAAWAEFRFGAGAGSSDMLLLAVGTGIGGGIVTGGSLFRGARGFAGEVGHIVVEPNGPLCGCGNRGCWEQVASGRAMDRLGREASRANPKGAMVEIAGGDPDRVTGPIVTAAAERGDALARGVIAEVGRRLGEGIAGLVNVLDPDRVVVAGGVIAAGDLLFEPVREAFRKTVEARGHRPAVPILPATLALDAAGIGAATLAREHAA